MSTPCIMLILIINILSVSGEFIILPGVIKNSSISMTCNKNNQDAATVALYKGRRKLGILILKDNKIVTGKIPKYGHLTKSTNGIKLIISISSCNDSGSYTCVDLSSMTSFEPVIKQLHVLDIKDKPIVVPTRKTTCNIPKCSRCATVTRAYVTSKKGVGLSCSASVPILAKASFIWKATATGGSTTNLKTFVFDTTSTTTFSGCPPNKVLKSQFRYQPIKPMSINMNIVCSVKYEIDNTTVLVLSGKLPVCVLAKAARLSVGGIAVVLITTIL